MEAIKMIDNDNLSIVDRHDEAIELLWAQIEAMKVEILQLKRQVAFFDKKSFHIWPQKGV